MKVVVLMENTTCREDISCAHGLSLYIETAKHRLLFDMGPDERFIENAEALGIDLSQVDTAFLSHAHNDHCGGLAAFLRCNDRAKVYMQRAALGDYYVVTDSKCAPIGLSPEDKTLQERFILCDDTVRLDDELTVFSRVTGRTLWSGANATLREKVGNDYPHDAFRHEQSLLVSENGKTALFAGCAHCGMANILKRAEEVSGKTPDFVLAGFHLYNPSLQRSEPQELVDAVGEALKSAAVRKYFTGHCTGKEAYERLHAHLGARIGAIPAGTELEL